MTISVVIPSYNGARFIERAIRSVLLQQRLPDEILVCDDHSTDDTLEICRRYQDRISVFYNPDGPSGFVNAWNNAIGRATGDYISVLHQDDVLSPECIRVGMAALESDPDIRHFFSTCHYIDAHDRIIGTSYPPVAGDDAEIRFSGPDYMMAYQGQGDPHIHRCPGVITHRSIFEECCYEPGAGHIADDDFFYRVGKYTDVIGQLTPLASFRIHAASITGALRDTELVGQLIDDYLYQCRQWKGDAFCDAAGYRYFVRHAHKYIRRYAGYGLRQGKMGMILQGIKKWKELRFVLYHKSNGGFSK